MDLGKQEQRIHEKYTRHECELNKDLAGCANTNNKAWYNGFKVFVLSF